MEFLQFPKLKGLHAFLGASQYRWLNYDNDKIIKSYNSNLAKKRGTELHEFAANAITYGIKLAGIDGTFANDNTIVMYVNDCIDYGLKPEQTLYYSEFCFGTTDAINFYDNKLYIFDLKTGKTKAKFEQLLVYAALFCLQYDIAPGLIDIELRIYQCEEKNVMIPTTEEVLYVMDRIMTCSGVLEEYIKERGGRYVYGN